MDAFDGTASTDEHNESISKLLDTGAYSDLTITCGTDTYAVHKAIVCTRSSFFADKCDSKDKDVDAKPNEINLSDDDPVAVRMTIQYLYRKDYVPPEAPTVPDPGSDSTQRQNQTPHPAKKQCVAGSSLLGGTPPQNKPAFEFGSSTPGWTPTQSGGRGRGRGQDRNSGNGRGGRSSPTVWRQQNRPPSPPPPPPPSNLVLHTKVYALGDKYRITGLKALALSKFKIEAIHHHHSESFLLATNHVYTWTTIDDLGIRTAIVSTIRDNVDLLENKKLKNVIDDTKLGLNLVMALTSTQRAELKRRASSL